MLTSLLNAWRDKPPVVDYLIMLGVAGCGLFEVSWLVLPLGAGLLAVGPVWKCVTLAGGHPQADVRRMVKEVSIDIIGYAFIASVAAYLVGLTVGRLLL